MIDIEHKESSVQPLVTVGVLSYNNAKYVIDTLESIANQTYKNIEILVNDDASTDDSVEVITKWINKHSELNIRFFQSQVNQGLCKACNNILRNSQGKYICLIGSDDRYLPAFIEKRVELLENTEPEVGFCYSTTYLIDKKGDRCGVETRPIPSGWVFIDLVKGFASLCKPFTCLIKKSCFEKIGFYDENLLYEDFDWFLRATKKFEVLFLNSFDTEYRIVPGSLGTKLNSNEGFLSNVAIIRKHLGYNKISDYYLRRRLFRLAYNAYRSDLKVSREIMKLSIRHFWGLKEILFLMMAYIPLNWVIKLKKLLRKHKIIDDKTSIKEIIDA